MAQHGSISGGVLLDNLERQNKNLSFSNTGSTSLLKLHVVDSKLSVNKETASNDVDVAGTTATDFLLGTTADIQSYYNITTNSLISDIGNITFNASEAIDISNFETSDLSINTNVISTKSTDSNLNLQPNGNGIVDIYNDTNVYGNIYAEGDITFDGTITIGDSSSDTLDFNTNISSDLIPETDSTHTLGSASLNWNTLYTDLVNGGSLELEELILPNFLLQPLTNGNRFYVTTNGDDANVGDHLQAPLASIKQALLLASSVTEPTAIVISAGIYEEEFPLVVPANVSVIGADLRNCVVTPAAGYETNDAFLLNDSSTVEHLCIKDFYYDGVEDTGYAFRFAPDAVITQRSPYVKNVTVITKGSVTSSSDPRGFNEGDAGKGALIDGADLNISSALSAMLFHSVTFITPGVDCITMTNGVRVEWLNSFTYFADKGLHAVNGTTGNGAEVRSIGSANIYGNYGAYADGDSTLMYLINHNFAYVGVGKDISNDNTLVTQETEAVMQNSGKIYYSSTDHTGTFRVGDTFFVDLESGTTSVNIDDAAFNDLSLINITTGDNTTIVSAEKIETGNIKISGNTVESLSGDLNIDTATTDINFNSSTRMHKNLQITGNLSFDGTLNVLGNQSTDTLTFNVNLSQDLVSKNNYTHNLGSSAKHWFAVYLSQLESENIKIYNNQISTYTTDTDLDIKANGTGIIFIPNNNVTFSDNTSVSGVTTVKSVSFTDTSIIGDVSQSGSATVTEDVTVDGDIYVNETVTIDNVKIEDNIITSEDTDTDLDLRANGTGTVNFEEDVEIATSMTVGTLNVEDFNISNRLTVNTLQTSETGTNYVSFLDNKITSLQTNSNLELSANNFGNISIPANNVVIDNELTVSDSSSFVSVSILGLLTQTGERVQTGNATISNTVTANTLTVNTVQFDDIRVDNNVISTTELNSDLDLRANGTGTVSITTNDVTVSNNLSADTLNSQNVSVTDNVDSVSLTSNSNINITENTIEVNPNTDMQLSATTTGKVTLDNVQFTTNTLSTLVDTITLTPLENVEIESTAAVTVPVGLTSERVGSYNTGGSFRFNQTDNLFEGYSSSTKTFGGIYSDNRETSITVHPTNNTFSIDINGNTEGVVTSNGLQINGLYVDNLQINNNLITTTADTDIDLRANGTGSLSLSSIIFDDNKIKNQSANGLTIAPTRFGAVKFGGTAGIVIPLGDTLTSTTHQAGETRWNTTNQIMEIFDGSEWQSAIGSSDVVTQEEFEDLTDLYTLIYG